jgi:2-methylcitrate dehydratase PrpD
MATVTSSRAAITACLARFAVSIRADDIPPDVVTHAKRSFLHTLGLAIAGTVETAPRILGEQVRELGLKGESTIIGQAFRCDAAHAALVNGAAADIIDERDTSVGHKTPPSVTIAPTGWAVGEQTHASGADVLAAQIVGTEVANKIGAGVKPGLQLRGWHPLAILNTFGAAATAGRLLGLDAPRMQNAFGIAAGEASGMRVAIGTMANAMGAGRSARDGIRAAILASMGFTGPMDVLEARDGFLQTFGDGVNGDPILDHLAAPFGPWEPSNPPTWTDVVAKFRGNAETTMSAADVDAVVATVERLEELDDIRTLMRLL